MVTSAVAPFLEQAIPSTPSAFDRSPSSRPLQRLFSYAAPEVPLADSVDERWTEGDFVIEEVSYATGPLARASARVVALSVVARALPGLIVLHCHSGIYAWGKEKVCAAPHDSKSLRRFRDAKYGGRSLAHDLAARGFVVLAPDAFYFGGRAGGGAGDVRTSTELDRRRRVSRRPPLSDGSHAGAGSRLDGRVRGQAAEP
jgi:hypothetical protein